MKFKNIKKKARNRKSPSNSRNIPATVKAPGAKILMSSPVKILSKRFVNLKLSFPKVELITLVRHYRRVLKIFIAVIFIVAVITVYLDLRKNFQVAGEVGSQRKKIVHDLAFWETFIATHQNYPDSYFQVSILEYRLGDTTKAKLYLEKGLSLDPNSTNGRKIEQLLK